MESFNEPTGRYNVALDAGELIALLPARLQPLRREPPAAAGAAAAAATSVWQALGAVWHDLAARVPPGVHARHLVAALVAVLVIFLGWSMINAALAGIIVLGVYTGVQREGGLSRAVKDTGTSAAGLIERVTGQQVTPAQALFLLVAISGMAYYFWLAPSPHVSRPQDTFGGYGAQSSGSKTSGRRMGDSTPYGASGGYDSNADIRGSAGGLFGALSSFDLSFLLSAGMLGSFVWNLGGGGSPEGWSAGQLVRRVQQMDIWQLLMLSNLVQQVVGGRGRRGYGGYGGYGRRRGFY